tara:strand:- start:63 stop:419 length:357 start_codon:yes stop_codon:yes gene_type:complete
MTKATKNTTKVTEYPLAGVFKQLYERIKVNGAWVDKLNQQEQPIKMTWFEVRTTDVEAPINQKLSVERIGKLQQLYPELNLVSGVEYSLVRENLHKGDGSRPPVRYMTYAPPELEVSI